MHIKFLIAILCVIFHSGLSHRDSERMEESVDEENKQLSDQASKLIEDENDDSIEKFSYKLTTQDVNDDALEKLNQLTSENVEDDDEKLNQFNSEDSEDIDDEKKKLQYPGIYEDRKYDSSAEQVTSNEGKNLMGVTSHEEEKLSENDEMEKAREAGDPSDFFGTNQHYNIPVNYQDFGRRFVLTYPYVEKSIKNDVAEAELDSIVKKYLQSKKKSKELMPVKAPPEFVIQIAKQSALLEASKPKNPTDENIQKDILRTGEYWDDVWKEEVDVKKILRSGKIEQNKLDSIKVKIPPGSKLHTLISRLKDKSPRFLYVINKNVERY